ncbi:hypothetical protein [Zavarzinella formosa]|uniref:hypothetical protein n=1 Tax=Zavarzinella formosa TaxID=360055 RepID=UPI0012F8641C|nr:hypothetical protein [Zavarzinella formosa]
MFAYALGKHAGAFRNRLEDRYLIFTPDPNHNDKDREHALLGWIEQRIEEEAAFLKADCRGLGKQFGSPGPTLVLAFIETVHQMTNACRSRWDSDERREARRLYANLHRRDADLDWVDFDENKYYEIVCATPVGPRCWESFESAFNDLVIGLNRPLGMLVLMGRLLEEFTGPTWVSFDPSAKCRQLAQSGHVIEFLWDDMLRSLDILGRVACASLIPPWLDRMCIVETAENQLRDLVKWLEKELPSLTVNQRFLKNASEDAGGSPEYEGIVRRMLKEFEAPPLPSTTPNLQQLLKTPASQPRQADGELFWNELTRELKLGENLCKKVGHIGKNMIRLLNLFQEQQWPASVRAPDDWIGDIEDALRLRKINDVVYKLNTNLKWIRFFVNTTSQGTSIHWKLTDEP